MLVEELRSESPLGSLGDVQAQARELNQKGLDFVSQSKLEEAIEIGRAHV